MSDDYRDPSGNTEAFRSFAARQEAPAPQIASAGPSKLPMIIAGVAAAVLTIAVIVFVAMS